MYFSYVSRESLVATTSYCTHKTKMLAFKYQSSVKATRFLVEKYNSKKGRGKRSCEILMVRELIKNDPSKEHRRQLKKVSIGQSESFAH